MARKNNRSQNTATALLDSPQVGFNITSKYDWSECFLSKKETVTPPSYHTRTKTRDAITTALEPKFSSFDFQKAVLMTEEIRPVLIDRQRGQKKWVSDFIEIIERAITTHSHFRTLEKNTKPETLDQLFENTYPTWMRTEYARLASEAQKSSPTTTLPKNKSTFKPEVKEIFTFYITPSAAPEQIAKFLSAFPKLITSLKDLGPSVQTPRIPFTLQGFVSANDRLTIPFSDQSLRTEIVEVVQQWAETSNLQLGQRTHDFGRDRIFPDVSLDETTRKTFNRLDIGTHSQRLARKLARLTYGEIKKNQRNDQEMAQWVIEKFNEILSSPSF